MLYFPSPFNMPFAPGGGVDGGPHGPGDGIPILCAGGNPEYEGGGPFASDNDPAESIPPIYDPREDADRYCYW
jgi:hypothetical protein